STTVTLPDEGCLTLIREANARDLLRAYAGLPQDLLCYHELGLPDILWVMFHPTGLRIVLGKGVAHLVYHAAGAITENGPGATRALIQCQDIRIRHCRVQAKGYDTV